MQMQVCQRLFQRPGEQNMSDLPIDRISADLPPFTYTGVDYFRPIERTELLKGKA